MTHPNLSELEQFINRNKPTRFFKIVRKYAVRIGAYSLEIRVLKDE